MQPSEWLKIKSVFYSALEVEECNRAAYVAKACDRDDDIRRKVEELLAVRFPRPDVREWRLLVRQLYSVGDCPRV